MAKKVSATKSASVKGAPAPKKAKIMPLKKAGTGKGKGKGAVKPTC